jgi:hypothetical protein
MYMISSQNSKSALWILNIERSIELRIMKNNPETFTDVGIKIGFGMSSLSNITVKPFPECLTIFDKERNRALRARLRDIYFQNTIKKYKINKWKLCANFTSGLYNTEVFRTYSQNEIRIDEMKTFFVNY